MSSSLFDITFPDIVNDVNAGRIKLSVPLQLHPSILRNSGGSAGAHLSACLELQRSAAQILSCAAAAAASAVVATQNNSKSVKQRDRTEIKITVLVNPDDKKHHDGACSLPSDEEGRRRHHHLVVVNYSSWSSFAATLPTGSDAGEDSRPSLSLDRFIRIADFLVNVASSPSLFDVALRVFVESSGDDQSLFSLSRVISHGFLQSARLSFHNHDLPHAAGGGAFCGGFRLVAVMFFWCFASLSEEEKGAATRGGGGGGGISQLFLFFAKLRDTLQQEAAATLMDLHRELQDESKKKRKAPTCLFSPGSSQFCNNNNTKDDDGGEDELQLQHHGLLLPAMMTQFETKLGGNPGHGVQDLSVAGASLGFHAEDLLATQTGTRQRPVEAGDFQHQEEVGDDNDEDDCHDKNGAPAADDFLLFGSGFGKHAYEMNLRRRSAALLIWSSLRRVVPSSNWILDMMQFSSSGSGGGALQLVSSDLFNLFLLGSAVNHAASAGFGGGMSRSLSDAKLESLWLAQCAGMNQVAAMVSPEHAAASASPSSLLGCASRLWWRRTQQVCVKISLDIARRSDSKNSSLDTLRGLTVRLDCCAADQVVGASAAAARDGSIHANRALAPVRAEVDAHLVRCVLSSSSSSSSASVAAKRSNNNERQLALAQSLALTTPSFSFPVLLLHIALVSAGTKESDNGNMHLHDDHQQHHHHHSLHHLRQHNNLQQQHRLVVCVYGAIVACCSNTHDKSALWCFAEETATIVSARQLQKQKGGLLRVFEFSSASYAGRAAESFASVCQELSAVPFSGFVHTVFDPSCTAPRCNFHLLDSGSFVQNKSTALRFFASELKRRQQQQQTGGDDVLSTLLLHNLTRDLPSTSPAEHHNITTASAMAARCTFHQFCDQLVHGESTIWVQRYLPPPPPPPPPPLSTAASARNNDGKMKGQGGDGGNDTSSSSSSAHDWLARFQDWGIERVAFVFRRAIAHHLRKSLVTKVMPNVASKNKASMLQPQLPGNFFSTVYQAPILLVENDGNDDDDDTDADGDQNVNKAEEACVLRHGVSTQRDNAATAMMLFAAATENNGFFAGDDKTATGAIAVTQPRRQLRKNTTDIVVETTQVAVSPSVAILKRWLKLFSEL